ncbi:hypothetical protein [Motiliproteus sp. SC1-56]|uniref:hypothetical protein n=1 Tax=Motiliproteus sp. SC1-56 TaxID=2799565 RepID=UPI001A8D3DF7|nr:hypothetical protein [Motiliproteus sp. SC1-56]
MKLFTIPIYIKVFSNRFVLNALDETDRELVSTPDSPFTTMRLLVGNFCEAEKTLSQGIKQLVGKRFIKKSPVALIHPLEKTEGGLSEVEIRIFNELAQGAGAVKAVVYEGQELSKREALAKLNDA